jgi:hypothetical protein
MVLMFLNCLFKLNNENLLNVMELQNIKTRLKNTCSEQKNLINTNTNKGFVLGPTELMYVT